MKRRSRGNTLESICLVMLLLVAGFVLLNSPLFAIREVVVEGNERLTAKQITGAASIPIGDNIFRTNLREAAARVEIIPAVKDLEIKRCLPGRVLIRLIERKAVVLVSGEDGLYGLDYAGVCIGRFDAASTLPVLTGAGIAPTPGKRLRTAGFRTAVTVLKSLSKTLIPSLAEIHVTPIKTVEAYTTEGVKICLGLPEDLPEKDRVLCSILKTVGDRKILYIDLNVAKRPVVKFVTQGVKDVAGNSPHNDAGGPLSGPDDRGSVSAFPRD
ncbi:MAG: FtsQ-type POTRA domain-containing protein [Bacillota bacterium]